jgi:type II pantothenate kinase
MEVLSKAVSRLSKYNTTRNKVLLFCSVTSAALAVLYNRWLERKALVRRIRQKKKREGSVNIGGIFGMDVGGTLTKIVYFEANLGGQSHDFLGGSSTSARKHTRSRSGIDHAIGSSDPGTQGIKRSSSLGEIYRPDHQEALHALYRNMKDFNSKTSAAVRDDHLSFYSNLLDGHVHFLHFETKNMTASVNLLSGTAIPENIRTIGCTGGGAHKFSKIFEEELSIKIDQYDELGSLIKGMHFALVNAVGECYTYRFDPSTLAPPSSPTVASGKTPNGHYYSHASATPSSISPSSSPTHSPKHSHAGGFGFGGDTPDNADSTNASRDEDEQSQKTRPINPNDAKKFNKRVAIPYEQLFAQKNMFPYLVVNIGSGVSIIKVTAPGEYERISGSSLGGGTYWGLCRLLTKCSSFGEALDLAELGDTTAVDMLVQDIYGGEYKGLKLSGSAVACSFGKMVMKERPTEGIKEEDFALALLMMITNNIGQVSYLNACLHKCSKIFFVGSFLRHNPISCRRLAYSINFWSKSEMEALFLTHEGYFGALGTFLISAFGTDIDKVLRLAQNAKGKSGKGKALAYASNIGLGGREKEGSSETESVSDVSDETNSRNSGVSIYGLDSDFIQRIRKWRPPTFRGVGGAEASEGNASGKCGRDSETGEYKERPTLSINARSVSVSKASNGALESGSRGQKEDRDRNERGSGTSSVPRNGLHSARRAEECE